MPVINNETSTFKESENLTQYFLFYDRKNFLRVSEKDSYRLSKLSLTLTAVSYNKNYDFVNIVEK